MSRSLVLGLGASGLAMARWLARSGEVQVADTRADPPMLADLRRELPQVAFHAGLEVALSPGLSPTHSDARPLVEAARKRGIELVGEIEIFARALAQLKAERGYAPRLVGITGTNGKTTTTRLAGLLIERAGRSVAVAGNIAPTALDTLRERLADDTLPDVWVLELSSFQLATTRSLACDAATILNVTQDHLDWHGTMDAYVAAKARIFGARTVRVLNRDDALVAALLPKKGTVLSFGAGVPQRAGEYGLLRDGVQWLACAEDVHAGARRRARKPEPPSGEQATPEPIEELHVQRLMPVDALQIRGRHNALNALAGLALARALDCPLAPLLHALREYHGEPHRVQHVARLANVDYYDDSKGTNVGATVAAIEGLGAEGQRLVLILGGDGKGQDFAPLAAPLAAHARGVVLIGRDGPRIGAALADASYPVEGARTLPEAVQAAAHLARAGDAVVLSPACASLDMFRNYGHRAEVFVAAVRELADAVGQPC
jgi:UDP-N-acetylmuramoylalanine--D-glutamate ligase